MLMTPPPSVASVAPTAREIRTMISAYSTSPCPSVASSGGRCLMALPYRGSCTPALQGLVVAVNQRGRGGSPPRPRRLPHRCRLAVERGGDAAEDVADLAAEQRQQRDDGDRDEDDDQGVLDQALALALLRQ